MKKFLTLIIATAVMLLAVSCTSTKTTVSTKDNVGYIQIVGNKAVYNGTIVITVDDKASYEIDINSDEDVASKRAVTYSIKPGTHTISISHDGEIVLVKKVLISEQEIRTVELP